MCICMYGRALAVYGLKACGRPSAEASWSGVTRPSGQARAGAPPACRPDLTLARRHQTLPRIQPVYDTAN